MLVCMFPVVDLIEITRRCYKIYSMYVNVFSSHGC